MKSVSPKTIRRLLLIIAAIVVTLIALSARLTAVAQLPIDYDEDDYLRAGQLYAQGIQQGDWSVFTRENYRTEHPPLSKIINGLVLSTLPPAPEIPDRPTTADPASSLPQPHLTSVRTTHAIFGTLEVLALALINPLAGLLLAVHTWTIKYTSQVMLEALPALTSLLVVVFYLRSRRKKSFNRWTLLSAIMLGLTAASKYPYTMVGVAVLIHWLWDSWPGRSDADTRSSASAMQWLRPILAWGGIALIVFFLADPYLWPDPINRLRASIAYHGNYATTAAEVQEANFPIWQPLVWLAQSVPWNSDAFPVQLDAIVLLFAIAGLKRLWQKYRVFALWLIIMFVFLLFWPTKWPQYVLMLTAPLALSAVEGFRAIIWDPLSDWVRRVRSGGVKRPTHQQAKIAWRETRQAFPWLVPGLIVLGLIALFPLIYQIAMSLTDLSVMSLRDGMRGGVWRAVGEGLTGQTQPVTVALFERSSSNQVRYAGSQVLLNLLAGGAADLVIFELVWTITAVSLQTAFGVGVALMLSRAGVRFKGLWRTLFILPWAIPEFVGAILWFNIFEPTNGWISLLLKKPFPWQSSPTATLLVLLIAALWMGWPLMMLASLAGLKMIPPDVYDAAAVDGAKGWARFRHVTWPLLLPVLTPVLIIRTILTFNQFYLFYVMQPNYPTLTLSTMSFFFFDATSGFGGQFAVAAAINVFTVLILLVMVTWFMHRKQTNVTEVY
jgi:ABC-type sugar transport system permease subunit/4-amino-4-deoxy-L-arabinose transferase-like glycosyltransferase